MPKKSGPETIVLFRCADRFYADMRSAQHAEKDKEIKMFPIEWSKAGIAVALEKVAKG